MSISEPTKVMMAAKDRRQTILHFHDYLSWNFDEIAELLDIKRQTAYTEYYRAKNVGKELQWKREWTSKNREKVRNDLRNWRANNREKIAMTAAQQKQYKDKYRQAA